MNKQNTYYRSAALGLGVLLGSSSVYAAGFQVNEQSAVNTGRASSVTATVKDPSAVWHNPAGLTNTEGTEFQIGVNMIRPHGRYRGAGSPATNPSYPNEVSAETDLALKYVPNV